MQLNTLRKRLYAKILEIEKAVYSMAIRQR